jgi:molybdate transport system substrate-binding protein
MLLRFLLVIAVCCGTRLRAEDAGAQLLIAAAADLRFALDDLLAEFRKQHPALDARASYGSSGTLFAQIEHGAPFDLFLSADAKFPRKLIELGKADKDSFFPYAVGHLVAWVPNESKLDVARQGLRVLLDPSVRKVAIANPEVAPYGAAAVAALTKLGLYDAVKPKLVLGENVAQAAQFVQSGAADAGIISLSLALAPRMKDAGRFADVARDAFLPIEQAGVVCTGGANSAAAAELRAFLLRRAARDILQRHGFESPAEAK